MTFPYTPRIWIGSDFESQPEYLVFSGGEPYVKLPIQDYLVPVVHARPTNATDWNMLLHLLDALYREGYDLSLWEMKIGYFPGGRQDREQTGVPFSLKVYADQLNAFGLGTVTIYDPHSHVTAALVNNSVAMPQPLIPDHPWFECIISPDAGAQHRTEDYLSRYLRESDVNFTPAYIQGSKHRDPRTGKLTNFSVDTQSASGSMGLVVDDICDGGGTFLGLADAFYEAYGVRDDPLSLYVTHGIFSRGTEELLSKYEVIYSTTSFLNASHLKDLNIVPVPLYEDEPQVFSS